MDCLGNSVFHLGLRAITALDGLAKLGFHDHDPLAIHRVIRSLKVIRYRSENGADI